jgi:fructokinase
VRGATIAVLGERIVDMVPVDDKGSYRALPGGSPANVALGLARLGMNPMLLGRRARDGFGAVLDEHMRASGLNLDGLIAADGLSMLAVCTRNSDGSVGYVFYHRESPDLCWTSKDLSRAMTLMTERKAVAWHTGSLVSWLGDGVDALIDAWHRAREIGGMTLSYDPNIRPDVQEPEIMRSRVEQFISSAHIVKASDEDVAYLYPEIAAEEVCARWAEAGPSLVVMTRGADGATVWQRDAEPLNVAGYQVAVADTVGAGDTVTAALLTGLASYLGPHSAESIARLPRAQVREIVERAAVAAAITCSRPGADPPDAGEVAQFIS